MTPKFPINSLKKSLSLANKTNQTMNKLRRRMIKPSIRSKIAKLADVTDGSAKSLVGDKISESIDYH